MRLAIVALLLSLHFRADAQAAYRVYVPVMLNRTSGMVYSMGEFTPLPLDPPISRNSP